MSTGFAILLFIFGVALMLKASRVGVAFILVALGLLAITGIEGFFLYILLPAAVLFVGWVIYFYFREKRRIAVENEIGRQLLERSKQSTESNT